MKNLKDEWKLTGNGEKTAHTYMKWMIARDEIRSEKL